MHLTRGPVLSRPALGAAIALVGLVASFGAEQTEHHGWGSSWTEGQKKEVAAGKIWSAARKDVLDQRLTEAAQKYTELLKVNPNAALVRMMRALVYAALSKPDLALSDCARLLDGFQREGSGRISTGWVIRATVYRLLGRNDRARADYELAWQSKKSPWECNQLADFLSVCSQPAYRDGKRALSLAREANEKTGYKIAAYVDTLATAEAEIGDFDKAVKYQQQALAMDAKQALNHDASKRLELFRARQPYRDNRSASEVVADTVRGLHP